MTRSPILASALLVGALAGVLWAGAPVRAADFTAGPSVEPMPFPPQAPAARPIGSPMAVPPAILTGHAEAAVPPPPSPPMPPGSGIEAGASMAARMAQLEAETAALRAEIVWLREHPAPAVVAPAPKIDPAKIAWKKGDFQIVPYGALWGTMAYDTERTVPGEYPLYVESPSVAGEAGFELDVRRTRLGLDIAGPDIAFFNAKSGGKVEIDFFGSFLQTENRAGVLLRHAYWQVKNEQYALLVGQSWDVISPLYTNTISYSVGWYGGNIGYRRAQVRLDRFLNFSDVSMVTVSLSANADIVSDFTTQPSVVREPADWPVMEGRIGWTLGQRGKGCDPITLGVSGHIGKQAFDFTSDSGPPLFLPPADDVQLVTWSLNADLRMPVTDRFGFQGELFMGENLGAFLGGIGQGACYCARQPIRARGGWGEFWYEWTPRLRSFVGAGIDDPIDRDLYIGRTYNQFVFSNVIFDITKQFQVGFEISNWKTHYKDDRTPASVDPLPGDALRFEAMAKYSF